MLRKDARRALRIAGVAHELEQRAEFERLLEQRISVGRQLRRARDDRDRHMLEPGLAAEILEHAGAQNAGHQEIEENRRRWLVVLEKRDRRCTIGRNIDLEAFSPKQIGQQHSDIRVVVDHQHERLPQHFVHELQELGYLDRLGNDPPRPGGHRFVRCDMIMIKLVNDKVINRIINS